MILILPLLFALSTAISIPTVSYRGDQVFRFQVGSPDEIQSLDDIIEEFKLDVWSKSRSGIVDVRINQFIWPKIAAKIPNIPNEVWIENLEILIKQEQKNASNDFVPTIFSNYQSTDSYIQYLQSLHGATPISIGKTYLGQEIKGVKIGTGKKAIVFNGGIHAREWISPSTVTYIADYLLGNSTKAMDLRSKFTFYAIPVLNIDGYEYSRTSERLWRKNRQPNQGTKCVGTDVNRNFRFKWKVAGSSGDPCDDSYAGPASFSTPEAQALDKFIGGLKNVVNYLDFHSFGQEWTFPWGWTCSERPKEEADFIAATKLGIDAIKRVSGTIYKSGGSCKLVYPTSGTTDDHMYASYKVKYSMTIELRDIGGYGFILPTNQIVPTGIETVSGLIAFWDYVYDH